MMIRKGEAWALVTARGGSKSIPLKNIHPVAGKPLLCYCLDALVRAGTVSRTYCTTDHPEIARVAAERGARILERPGRLRGDLVASVDVVLDAVAALGREPDGVAEIVVLVQPTSIFLLPGHVDAVVQAMLASPEAQSGQTVIPVPHQFHAYNQRAMSDDGKDIGFMFWEERKACHNKQTKPKFYAYGNLIATRAEALLATGNLFARPSVPVLIDSKYAYDLDGYADIPLAETMLSLGMVDLGPKDPEHG